MSAALLKRYGALRSPAGVLQSQQFATFRDDRALHRLELSASFGVLPTSPNTERILADNVRLISPRTARIRYLAGVGDEEREQLAKQGIIASMANRDHLAVPLGPAWEAPATDLTPATIPDDAKGQACIAATTLAYPPLEAAEGPRLAIWGSRDAASDGWLDDSAYRNELFFLDLIADLANREQAVPIDQQNFAVWQVTCSDSTLTLLVAILVAIMPSCCIGIAILTWWERR